MKRRLCVSILALLAFAGARLAPNAMLHPVQASPSSASIERRWFIETVDTTDDVGQFASLGLAVGAIPLITYYDATHHHLRFAVRSTALGQQACSADAAWNCFTLDTWNSGDVGQFSSIWPGPTIDRYRYAYYNATAKANYVTAVYPDGSESTPPDILAATNVGRYNSLKANASGRAIIAYQNLNVDPPYSDLRFAEKMAGDGSAGFCATLIYECTTIDSSSSSATLGAFASLDIGDSNSPAIAYAGANGELKLARKGSSGNCGDRRAWQCDVIDGGGADVGNYISLHLNRCTVGSGCGDFDQIAYYDSTHETLKYAHYVGLGGNCGQGTQLGLWQCDVIENVGQDARAMGVSLVVQNGGNPTIAYYRKNEPGRSNGVLKITRPATNGNCGPSDGLYPSWQCTVVDFGGSVSPHDVGLYASAAVNSAGMATIAYYDATSGDLKVAFERMLAFLPHVAR